MNQKNGMIKVAMVGALPFDLQSVKGGVETVILNLFYGFSQLPDIEVVHIAFSDEAREVTIRKYSERVRVCFLPTKSRFRLLDYVVNQKALMRVLKQESPDIIHIQESNPQLLRFLFYPKARVVVTQHGIMRECLKYAKGLEENLKFLFKTVIERYVFPRFKNIVFISNYNERLFHGVPAHSRIIYNPVNPIFFDERPNLKDGSRSIIYVATISRGKNIKMLLEAIHELNQLGILYSLHVVGGYKEPGFEKEVVGWVNKMNLREQVTFHGWLKQTEILNVFDECDYFVLPSLQETLPMSIAEAMALGKVVIATEVGGVPEMFRDGITGHLLQPNNRHQLVGLLKQLQSAQKPELKKMVKEESLKKFSPIEVARRTVYFYREILGREKTNH
jgi:glycosyltransferase involved in cell wall biosynthesis